MLQVYLREAALVNGQEPFPAKWLLPACLSVPKAAICERQASKRIVGPIFALSLQQGVFTKTRDLRLKFPQL